MAPQKDKKGFEARELIYAGTLLRRSRTKFKARKPWYECRVSLFSGNMLLIEDQDDGFSKTLTIADVEFDHNSLTDFKTFVINPVPEECYNDLPSFKIEASADGQQFERYTFAVPNAEELANWASALTLKSAVKPHLSPLSRLGFSALSTGQVFTPEVKAIYSEVIRQLSPLSCPFTPTEAIPDGELTWGQMWEKTFKLKNEIEIMEQLEVIAALFAFNAELIVKAKLEAYFMETRSRLLAAEHTRSMYGTATFDYNKFRDWSEFDIYFTPCQDETLQDNKRAAFLTPAAEADVMEMKFASLEMKTLSELIPILIKSDSEIIVPLACAVTYLGFKVTCAAEVAPRFRPNDVNLVYGRDSAGNIRNSVPQLESSLEALGAELNIAPHDVCGKRIYLSAELGIHVINGSYYLLSSKSLLPPLVRDNEAFPDITITPKMVLEHPSPINPDVFLEYNRDSEEEHYYVDEIKEQTAQRVENVLQTIDNDFSLLPLISTNPNFFKELLKLHGLSLNFVSEIAESSKLPLTRWICTLEALSRTAKELLFISMRSLVRHGGFEGTYGRSENFIAAQIPCIIEEGDESRFNCCTCLDKDSDEAAKYAERQEKLSEAFFSIEKLIHEFAHLLSYDSAASQDWWSEVLIPATQEKFNIKYSIKANDFPRDLMFKFVSTYAKIDFEKDSIYASTKMSMPSLVPSIAEIIPHLPLNIIPEELNPNLGPFYTLHCIEILSNQLSKQILRTPFWNTRPTDIPSIFALLGFCWSELAPFADEAKTNAKMYLDAATDIAPPLTISHFVKGSKEQVKEIELVKGLINLKKATFEEDDAKSLKLSNEAFNQIEPWAPISSPYFTLISLLNAYYVKSYALQNVKILIDKANSSCQVLKGNELLKELVWNFRGRVYLTRGEGNMIIPDLVLCTKNLEEDLAAVQLLNTVASAQREAAATGSALQFILEAVEKLDAIHIYSQAANQLEATMKTRLVQKFNSVCQKIRIDLVANFVTFLISNPVVGQGINYDLCLNNVKDFMIPKIISQIDFADTAKTEASTVEELREFIQNLVE